MRATLMLTVVLACRSLTADPVLHKFELWGKATEDEKLWVYAGWTNGFFQARGQRSMSLRTCLEGISQEQAVAMVSKQYNDHPEKWSHPLGEQMLEALTVAGSPCEGKNLN